MKKNKYTISVDRLDIIASTNYPFWNKFNACNNPDIIGNRIILYPLTSKSNPFFNYGFKLELDKEFIATIYCKHNNRLRYNTSNPVKIEVQNNILYQNAWAEKLNYIFSELNLRFYKYNYAEIAIDGYDIINIQKSLMDSEKYFRKQSLRNISVSRDETNGNITSICCGSRKSDKYIAIYNKQGSIEREGKLYIKDFWKMNSLELVSNRQIDRIELRLKKNPVRLLSPNFSDLNDPNYLASFFKKFGGHYLEYIHKAISKNRKCIVDWKQFDKVEILKPQTNNLSDSILGYKTVIKKLYLEFAKTGKDLYRNSFNELAKNYNLIEWLDIKLRQWNKELRLRY